MFQVHSKTKTALKGGSYRPCNCDVEADPWELTHGQGNKVICLKTAERLKTSVHINSELRKHSFYEGFYVRLPQALSGAIPRNVVTSVNFLRSTFAKVFTLECVLTLSCGATEHFRVSIVGQREWDTKSNFAILSKTFTVLKIIIVSHKLKVLIHH